jgi:hypothetical protein
MHTTGWLILSAEFKAKAVILRCAKIMGSNPVEVIFSSVLLSVSIQTCRQHTELPLDVTERSVSSGKNRL